MDSQSEIGEKCVVQRAPWLCPRSLLLVLVFLAAKPGVAPLAAGAWVQDTGGYYVQAWIGDFRADEEFDIHGERRELYYADGSWRHSVLEERGAGLYAEYGLTPKLKLICHLP